MMEHITLQTKQGDISRKPKARSQISKTKDLSFLSNKKLNYQIIVNPNNQKMRIYRRKYSDELKQSELFTWRAESIKPIVRIKLIQNMKPSQGNGNTDSKTCGITEKGDCKVWINDNLSENKGGMRPKLQQEGQILSQILKIIKKCSSNQCTSFFSNLLKCIPSFEKLKFRLVDDFINSYCCKNQITVPLYLKYYEQVKQKSNNDTIISLTPNKKIDIGKNKDKSYSNCSNSNSVNRHRGSDATYSGANLLKPLQQRTSMFQAPDLWKAKSSYEQPNSNFVYHKNSISTTNSLLRSTFSGSNCFKQETKFESKSSNSNRNVRNTHGGSSNPSSQDVDLQTIPSINNLKGSQNGHKRGLPSCMMNSFNNEMVSLNNILCSIKEDQLNDMIDSDHIIQNTRKQLQAPSTNQVKILNDTKNNRKSICHQFCIHLIYENKNSSISSTPKKTDLKTSFATTIKSSPFGRASLNYNFAPFSSQNNTPRVSPNQTVKSYKNSTIKTSYYQLQREFDQGNLSPRFSCEQIESKQLKQGFFDYNRLYNPTKSIIKDPCYCVREVQSSSFIPSEKQLTTSNGDSNKQNQNKVYLKLEEEKRLNKKRRNSRLLRQKLQEIQREKIDQIKMYQQENRILSANNWIKVVNNLVQSQSDLKESVSFEVPWQKKKNDNLIRLEKLDQYGHGMTQSIIPQ